LVVRNGHAAPRQVSTGAGPIDVVAPRVNDRRTDPATGQRQRFRSAILPPWCRKSPKASEVLPLLYLHGALVRGCTGRDGPRGADGHNRSFRRSVFKKVVPAGSVICAGNGAAGGRSRCPVRAVSVVELFELAQSVRHELPHHPSPALRRHLVEGVTGHV
jgi:hypothetical protein